MLAPAAVLTGLGSWLPTKVLDNHEIAERFGISEKTVRNHASVIFEKIGAKSRAHAVALARDAGLGAR